MDVSYVGMVVTATNNDNIKGYFDRAFNFVASVSEAHIMTNDQIAEATDKIMALNDSEDFKQVAVKQLASYNDDITEVYNKCLEILKKPK